MPEFELIPRQQAMMSSSTRSRSDAIREYSQFIEHLGREEAGKLTPSDGETVATVRRRLGSAVKASGKNVQIKATRGGDILLGRTVQTAGRQTSQRTPTLMALHTKGSLKWRCP